MRDVGVREGQIDVTSLVSILVTMANPKPSTKDKILRAAYKLFYREGFSRVSVDAIADQADVTKRTVYYHFTSKDEVVAEVLRSQDAYLLRQFQDWAGAEGIPADKMLANLFAKLRTWTEAPRWLGSGFTRITTELADMPGHPARIAASAHKARVESWLADALWRKEVAEPQAVARQIMTLIEGAISLTLIHGDAGYISSAGDAAQALIKVQKS